jgi:hypothetical protein
MPDYGNRPDKTKKGMGYFGELKLPKGGVATEYGIGVKIEGQEMEIPTLVPTLSKKELDMMVNDVIPNNRDIPESVIQKAVDHARMRVGKWRSPFAEPDDYPKKRKTASQMLSVRKNASSMLTGEE